MNILSPLDERLKSEKEENQIKEVAIKIFLASVSSGREFETINIERCLVHAECLLDTYRTQEVKIRQKERVHQAMLEDIENTLNGYRDLKYNPKS